MLHVQALEANNYTGPYNSPAWLAQPVFIQSFEVHASLVSTAVPCMPVCAVLCTPVFAVLGCAVCAEPSRAVLCCVNLC